MSPLTRQVVACIIGLVYLVYRFLLCGEAKVTCPFERPDGKSTTEALVTRTPVRASAFLFVSVLFRCHQTTNLLRISGIDDHSTL